MENKLIEEENGYFNLTRTAFLKLRQQYKFIILINDRNSMFVIPVLIGIIATLVSGLSSFDKIFNFKKTDRSNDSLAIVMRISNIEKHILDFEKTYSNKLVSFDTLELFREILGLKKDYKDLSNNLLSLNTLLQEDPKRFVEISTINKDIEKLKDQIDSNNESLKREVDRISSYNNTLIVFMITFLVAYIGIGIFNNLNRKKDIT